jgi:hypothetical protein
VQTPHNFRPYGPLLDFTSSANSAGGRIRRQSAKDHKRLARIGCRQPCTIDELVRAFVGPALETQIAGHDECHVAVRQSAGNAEDGRASFVAATALVVLMTKCPPMASAVDRSSAALS